MTNDNSSNRPNVGDILRWRKKKDDGHIVIETHLVGARKSDITARKWR